MPVSRTAKCKLKNRKDCSPYSAKLPVEKPIMDRPKVVVVNGVELQTTVVFDTFFRWCAERQAIDKRKRAGEPAPWTQDKILRNYKFTNVYPVSDRGSQFLIKSVIEKGSQEPVDVLFRILLYQAFARPSTFELIEKHCSPLTWANYSREKIAPLLKKVNKSKTAVFTAAYQNLPPPFDEEKTQIDRALRLVEVLMDRDFLGELAQVEYFGEVYEILTTYQNFGPFHSFQMMRALSYTNIIHFHRNDWAIAGPGTVSGMRKMFGDSFSQTTDLDFQLSIMRWFVDNAPAQFQRLGLEFDGLGPDHLPLSVVDVEHAICEVDKYARLAHPRIKGTKERKSIKACYKVKEGSGEGKVEPMRLPKAWDNPKSKVERICPRPIVASETRYIVEKILGHETDKNGKIKYIIKWEGYLKTSKEPKEHLDGAMDMLREYRAKKGLPALK